MKLDYIALFLVLFFLAACGSKSSSPDMVDDNALPVEETFKDIDLANNLKDCGKPLLLSDIVKAFSRNGSLTVYDMRDNSFVKEFSLKWPVFFSWTIDVMGDCLVYYPGTVYLPDNSKTFISACVANGKGETLMEQIPYLSSGDKEIVQLSSDPSWLYRGRSNVYSFINDTIYGITCDSIFPRYHLSLGKYKLPSGRYDPTHDYGWGDFVLMQSVYETKEFLFLKQSILL